MTSQRDASSPEAEVTASRVGESVGAVLAAHPVHWRLSSAVGSCSGGKMADRAIINNKNRQTSEQHLANAAWRSKGRDFCHVSSNSSSSSYLALTSTSCIANSPSLQAYIQPLYLCQLPRLQLTFSISI